jgi:hypothetical protein
MDDEGGWEDADFGGPPPAWTPAEEAIRPADSERPRTTGQRFLQAAAWIVGVLALGLFGRVYALFGGATNLSAEEIGRLIGSIVGALIIGLFVRLLIVRIRRRGRVRSPWILVVAVLVLLLGIGNQPRVGASGVSAVSIGSYVRIGAPYALADPNADETDRFATQLAKATAGAYEVRRVLKAGQLVGYLVVADLGTDDSAEFRRGLAQGFIDDGGVEAHEATVAGRPVVIGTRTEGAVAMWVEPPFALTVYGADPASAEGLAAAVMAAYK